MFLGVPVFGTIRKFVILGVAILKHIMEITVIVLETEQFAF